ncbi:hypothetical protein [Aurantimonas sp. 22II-16-19i]|uniref:DUF4376 domain-containing protein n=1 Tax=Aurantimonas sp. 22II-16-19i TaxID=1317114 RepID=UPI00111C4C8E|nr:hypothetical protein [Aurantimonas sp. 22II-16-19i]
MRVAVQALPVADRDRVTATPVETGYDLNVPDDLLPKMRGVDMAAALVADHRDCLLAAINARRDAVIAAGYQHNFGATAGIRRLDQRDARDDTAWLSVKLLASDLIAAGQGSQAIQIRDAGNETFSTSAETADAAMSAMGVWRSAVSSHSWTLKDAVNAAADEAALDAIDITEGWPGD